MTFSSGAVARWLRGDDADRARFLAVRARLSQLSRISAVVAVPHLLTAWWAGPVIGLLVLVAVATLATSDAMMARTRNPELVEAVGMLVLVADLALSIWLTGGASSPLLCLVAVTAFAQAVSFRLPVLFTGCGVAVGLTVLAATTAPALPPDRVPPAWIGLVSLTVLLVMLGTTAYAIVHAETAARTEARTDPLTGLFHRRALGPAWLELRRIDAEAGRCSGVLIVDLDHFKAVNDTHGHERGDQVLVGTAQRIRSTMRPGDVVVRFGGEEFVVLLPGADGAGALAAAERLRVAIGEHPVAGLPVTASIGATSASHGDLDELLRIADEALYRAKHEGRDRTVLAMPTDTAGASPDPALQQ